MNALARRRSEETYLAWLRRTYPDRAWVIVRDDEPDEPDGTNGEDSTAKENDDGNQ